MVASPRQLMIQRRNLATPPRVVRIFHAALAAIENDIMNLTYAALGADYTKRLADLKPAGQAVAQADAVAKRLCASADRFEKVMAETGVPAVWLMAVFEREGPDFSCYLGNGQPLDRVTTEVPHGRGPFSTWEAGCEDALRLDDVAEVATWSWAEMCFQWEKWNGFGPREHGRTSGYLWSGTNQYNGGKYIADGVWSPRTWDKQLGCVIVAQRILAIAPSLAGALTDVAPIAA